MWKWLEELKMNQIVKKKQIGKLGLVMKQLKKANFNFLLCNIKLEEKEIRKKWVQWWKHENVLEEEKTNASSKVLLTFFVSTMGSAKYYLWPLCCNDGINVIISHSFVCV